MIGIAKNYDGLCYHLKVVHKNLDHPLKRKLDTFLEGIKTDLIRNDVFLSNKIEEKFSSILNIRLSALKWLLVERQNFSELIDNEAYPYFEKLLNVERLSGLAENVLFALRCNKKVIRALLKSTEEAGIPTEAFFEIPEISFDQFITSVYLSAPNVEAAETGIEWIKSSLRIEYVIFATSVIYDENILLRQHKIEELSAIIVDAAQTYSAIAIELGIFSSKKAFIPMHEDIENAVFLEDQKNLAETGLDLFAQNWKD